MKNIAVILAAGSSTRCGFNKLTTDRFGPPVLNQTLQIFQQCEVIDEILLVGPKPHSETIRQFTKIKNIIDGGNDRFSSFQTALAYLEKQESNNCRIIVHNGANPKLKISDLEAGIQFSGDKKNVIFGFFTPNSIKKVVDGKVIEFLNRDEIFQTQTPQISDLDTFTKALNFPKINEKNIRDEAELLKLIDEEIFIYECCQSNTKITFSHDFPSNNMPASLIGIGQDSHRFAEIFVSQKPVILGGIPFPESQKSFEANSDGDVIFHALCNAILSSVGEKTLDTFAAVMCKNGLTNSQYYLEKALEIAQQKKPDFSIKNCIISLEALVPKIAAKHDLIQENIANRLNLKKEQVGLTYTTGEGLSDFGKGLGVNCLVEILLD